MRVCTKMSCRNRASASCAFNYDDRLVWISELVSEDDRSFYDLCDLHVESLRAPRGWALEDRRSRTEQPSLLG